MKERPILMSAPMVLRTLDGSKTQTRRLVKPQPTARPLGWGTFEGDNVTGYRIRCPYGQPGDRLWVRETWGVPEDMDRIARLKGRVLYRATDSDKADPNYQRWRPSIHMPRWASRLTLDVTGIRVERLAAISDADAIAEGIEPGPIQQGPQFAWHAPGKPGHFTDDPRNAFHALWKSINGEGSWASNPWVWVISFKRVTP